VRHLLLLTPALDADDPVLGFAVGWTNALARHVPRISVLALRLGNTASLAPGIQARALGRGRARIAASVIRAIARMDRPDVALAQMNWPLPLAALPALRARRIPLALWWAHGAAPLGLRAVLPFAARVLTSAPSAFPLPTAKCVVVGQGIDTQAFSPAAQEPAAPFTVLTAGRLAPVKRVPLVARACADAGVALRVVGPPGAAVPHRAMPDMLRAAHAFATASATGSPDKAALEAMACALPVVALGEGLRTALPDALADQVIVPDLPAMAARLAALAAMPEAVRRGFGLELRTAVLARHDRAAQVARIAAELQALAR
jgi:glycosyltransferase involved in cell wall biosynthesis